MLLALALAAALLYYRIGSSFITSSILSSTSPSPVPSRSPSVVGSLVVSRKATFRCTLPVTTYSRRVRIDFSSGAVTVDGDQTSDVHERNANTYSVGDGFLLQAQGCHLTAYRTPQ